MEAAINAAKESIFIFFDALESPATNQRSFLLKVVFEHEHIWLADLDLSRTPGRGVVANEPKLPELKFMQTVEFDPSQITDWMFVEDGYLVGGFTTRLIRDRMSLDERRAYDARAPYKFR